MNIIIFNSLLLPASQTFIRDPAEKLTRYRAYYVGCRRVSGLDLPEERTLAINSGGSLGKLQEQLFKLSGYAPTLYHQLQQLNPGLIHAQFGLSGVLILPWVQRLKLPLIVHYRGADATAIPDRGLPPSLNHWLYLRRKAALQQRTQLFLTVSKFIKQKLLDQGFPPDKVQHHYHGVDVEQFCPDPTVAREPVVLFVGRLTPKKGCDDLIRAMAQVQAVYPETQLVIIGQGPLQPALEALAASLLKRYTFLGRQTPASVKQWMNRAQILAAPSVTAADGDSEGLPNVVLEAQAMGLPVVSTYHAGIPEAVIHRQTGLLSPEHDIKGLAEHIQAILQNPNLWQQLSHQGRTHMVQHFNRTIQTQRLEAHYDTVLARWCEQTSGGIYAHPEYS